MKNINWNYLATSVFILFTLIVSISFVLFVLKFSGSDISERLGDWSDYSACITALFAYVSLIFIYIAYKNQVIANKSQASANYKLQFDSTFFNMLQIQREILGSLAKGHFINRKASIIGSYSSDYSGELKYDDALKKIKKRYQPSPHTQISSDMHYFRHLYHIIKLVRNSDFNETQQREYIDIIQAQMSNEELFVMFYNVVFYGNKEYLLWLDDYGFFENIRPNGTLFDKLKVHFFPNTNFKHKAYE
jgi:uncharacterized membrane protein